MYKFKYLILLIPFVIAGCASFPDPVDKKSAAIIGKLNIKNAEDASKYGVYTIFLTGSRGQQIKLSGSDITKDGYFIKSNIEIDNYTMNFIEAKRFSYKILYSETKIYQFNLSHYRLNVKEGRINFLGDFNIKVREYGTRYNYSYNKNVSLNSRKEALNKIIKKHPRSDWCHIAKNNINQIDKTFQYYKTAQEDFLNKKYKKALKNIDKAIEIVDDSSIYYNLRGLINQKKKDYELALLDFNKAIDIDANYAEAYFNRGRTFELKKDKKSAVKDFLSSTKYLFLYNKHVSPKNALDYFNIAQAYLEEEKPDYKKAVNYLNKSIKMTKNFASSYFTLGYCYSELKDYKNSIKFYKKYTEFNSDSYWPYYNMANNYLKLKNYNSAIKYFKKVLKLNNDYYYAYAEIAFCWYKKNNFSKAFDNIMKAIQIQNQAHWLYVYQGKILLLKEKNKEAIESFTKAIKISNEKNFRAYYNRSTVYKKTGKNDKAEDDMEKAKELNEKNEPWEYNVD